MKKYKLLRTGAKAQDGFLLVDAVIAVLVVAIALVALTLLYVQGTKSSVTATRHEKGVQIAAEWMEYLKAAEGQPAGTAYYTVTDNLIGELAVKKGKLWKLTTNTGGRYEAQVQDETNAYTYKVQAEYFAYSDDSKNNHDQLKKIWVQVVPDDPQTKTIELTSFIALKK